MLCAHLVLAIVELFARTSISSSFQNVTFEALVNGRENKAGMAETERIVSIILTLLIYEGLLNNVLFL